MDSVQRQVTSKVPRLQGAFGGGTHRLPYRSPARSLYPYPRRPRLSRRSEYGEPVEIVCVVDLAGSTNTGTVTLGSLAAVVAPDILWPASGSRPLAGSSTIKSAVESFNFNRQRPPSAGKIESARLHPSPHNGSERWPEPSVKGLQRGDRHIYNVSGRGSGQPSPA
jgi:hypothetical protein